MAPTHTPDLCIIGAGAGGLAAALEARALGASVVLVDPDGGAGRRRSAADLPAMGLVAAAHAAHGWREAARLNMPGEAPRPSFRALAEHLGGLAAELAPNESDERLAALGVMVITGQARFADPRTLSAAGATIRARRFVIATGALPAVPAIPGLDAVPYFTTETVFEALRRFTHLVVIGAGARALELAQAYRRLGAEVSLVAAEGFLTASDPELVRILLDRLREEGVSLFSGRTVTGIVARSQGIGVRLAGAGGSEEVLDASHLLVAAGRAPRIAELGLDQARVRSDPLAADRLWVGAALRTSNRRIYAVGEAAGGAMSAHAAARQGRLVARHAVLGEKAAYDPLVVPRLVHGDPELAEIGLTEAEARRRFGKNFTVTRWSFAENDRARALGRPEGLARLLTDPRGRILGAGIVGPQAGELIAPLALAMAKGLTTRDLLDAVLPHPSLSEIVGQLALAQLETMPKSPWQRRRAALYRLLP